MHRHLPLPIQSIKGARIVTPEGKARELELYQEFSDLGRNETLVLIDFSTFHSSKLSEVSPSAGTNVYEKFAILDFVVTVEMSGDAGHFVELRNRVFCKMIPSGDRQLIRKVCRVFRRSYSNLPEWSRFAVRGSFFLANLVMDVGQIIA